MAIEGHTDAKPYAQRGDYGNWELSADRANAARRLMQQNGVRADQVTQVRGFADQKLRKPDDPSDPSNRRISLIVQYLIKPPEEEDDAPSAAEGNAKVSASEKAPEKAPEKEPLSQAKP